MSHVSINRQGWLPLPRPDPQLSLSFPDEDRSLPPAPTTEEWAAMETDVVDGVFRPPMRNEGVVRVRHYPARPRNRHLHEERVPASLFSYDAESRTYKTTAARLRPRTWSTLITVVGDDGAEVPFRLFQVVRRGDDWTRMRFRHLVAGEVLHELVVLNNEFDAASSVEPEQGITVVRDGNYWVARFPWSDANVAVVRRAGFRFSPVQRWWYTRDDRIAARLDKSLISVAIRPAKRRPLIRTWR